MRTGTRRQLTVLSALLVLLTASCGGAARSAAAYTPPPIRHVWVIPLENESYSYTFGAVGRREAPYLAKTLPRKGALLKNYYGTAHNSAPNYVAMISGQANNPTLAGDCPVFAPFSATGAINRDGQLPGAGCVFPKRVKTIGNQLTHRGLSWREYAQNMGRNARRDGTRRTQHGPACGHPRLGSTDLTDTIRSGRDSYATRHNPFVYFRSVIGRRRYCDSHVLSLRPLAHDLRRASRTPNYSFITPNTCNDGHDWPRCANGRPGRLPRINRFLRHWIPKIMHSPAYRHGGLILITFDESDGLSDSTACCGATSGTSPSHPNLANNGITGPGGGRVGAIVLSKYVKPGTVSTRRYNHYSQLRSIEDLFRLSHLGDARLVRSFGRDVYTRRRR